MKKKEIKKLTEQQSLKEFEKLKKDLFNIRFQKVNGQIKNPSKINETKKKYSKIENNDRNKKCLKKY